MILAAACTTGDRGAATVARDSAGVRIIENSRPAHERGAFVDPVPTVQVGVVEGDESLQFQYISGIVRLSNGAIVVADRSNAVRWFDGEGRHVRTVGGTGDGPGEFQSINAIRRLANDTVLVLSHFGVRVTLLDAQGNVARIRTLVAPIGMRDGLFADGALLTSWIADSNPPTATGLVQNDVILLALPLDDESLTADLGGTPVFEPGATIPALGDTIVRLPGPQFFRQAVESGGRVIGISSRDAPFGAGRHSVAHGAALYTGDGVEFDVSVYSHDGSLARIVRIAEPRTPLSEEHIAIWESSLRNFQMTPAQLRRVERLIEAQTYPEFLPAYSALVVDSEGHLWVERYRLRRDDAQRWCIFDPDGRWLAEAVTPAGLEIHVIGEDWVLGVWRDENDVEFVRLHRLTR